MAGKTVAVTDGDFEEVVVKSDLPVLVDFWAPWCGPCLSIGPTLEALAEEYDGRIKVCKMNIDENANTPATLGVRSIPYLVLFKDGEAVGNVVGAVPKAKLAELMERGLG